MRTESRIRPVEGVLYTTGVLSRELLRMFVSTEERPAKEGPLRSGLCLPEAAANKRAT